MHHVLYEWSELVEIDQRLNKLEKGIELVKEINVLKEHIKNNDLESILNNLKKIVIDYYPNRKIIDHTFMKK